MDTSNTTPADLASVTPENYRRELTSIADQWQRQHDDQVRSLNSRRGAAKAQRVYRGRQVLVPGKRKAARHPWADRLHAARTAGFIVETEGDATFYKCYACGEGGGIAGQSSGSQEDLEAEDYFREEIRRHSTGACITGVTL